MTEDEKADKQDEKSPTLNRAAQFFKNGAGVLYTCDNSFLLLIDSLDGLLQWCHFSNKSDAWIWERAILSSVNSKS